MKIFNLAHRAEVTDITRKPTGLRDNGYLKSCLKPKYAGVLCRLPPISPIRRPRCAMRLTPSFVARPNAAGNTSDMRG